ncbi:hypothetical protein Fcan01_15569 [Folsomia candida]|uniref:Uncharacterized protein n=1 Tax=Folsomia candida TaxID=158441 RepID=A0A226DWW7_FOLCA|nr:hypothetical protein Fcan01_15569 [Folsomia candida]
MVTKEDSYVLQRYLRIAEYLKCLPVKWDSVKGIIVIRSSNQQKFVILTILAHFLATLCRLYSTTLYPSSILNRAEAAFGAILYAYMFIIRLDIPVDYGTVDTVNFMITSKNSEARLPYRPMILILFASSELLLFITAAISGLYYNFGVLLKGVAYLWIDCKNFVNRYEHGLVTILEYRKVQAFEKCLNSCIRSRIFFCSALTVPTIQITLCYVAIKSFQSDDRNTFKGAMFLWTYFMAMGFTMMMFTVGAKISNLSKNWISRSRWNIKRKWERKVHKSLAPLSLKFGNNFVERLTPLVVQEFCVRQTVSFLLVSE